LPAKNNGTTRVERLARLKWVPIEKMRVSPMAQRDLNPARVDHLAAHFDPEQIGHPVVSFRDGHYWIIDGQHRIEALKEIGWGDQSVQCEVYEGLAEQDEAELFLVRNDVLAVPALDKFKVGVNADREAETDINRIVLAHELVVTRDKIPGAIAAVGTLQRVYKRAGGPVLGRTLRIVRDAYGDPGLEAAVIDGIGHLCQRYNGDLNDSEAVSKLTKAHGGVNGLLGKAENIRRSTGNPKAHCVAAAAVEIINSGKGGKKLPSWWKADG
jgi:hypothetical protein